MSFSLRAFPFKNVCVGGGRLNLVFRGYGGVVNMLTKLKSRGMEGIKEAILNVGIGSTAIQDKLYGQTIT